MYLVFNKSIIFNIEVKFYTEKRYGKEYFVYRIFETCFGTEFDHGLSVQNMLQKFFMQIMFYQGFFLIQFYFNICITFRTISNS